MLEEDEDLILLNPGSLSYPRQEGGSVLILLWKKKTGKSRHSRSVIWMNSR
ncbi:MAG: hypothetical protein ACLU80_03015 [Dorea sp.]